MKLYEAPRNSHIRIVGETKTAPFSKVVEGQEVLKFYHIDGMYSLCKTESGAWCHPSATTEVEIVNEETGEA